MKTHHCYDCEQQFSRSELLEREDVDVIEAWGRVFKEKFKYLECPNCGSDQIEEVNAA